MYRLFLEISDVFLRYCGKVVFAVTFQGRRFLFFGFFF